MIRVGHVDTSRCSSGYKRRNLRYGKGLASCIEDVIEEAEEEFLGPDAL
jgi:hypothetical protein